LIGSYACSDLIPERIRSGEGLLGQSVIERKVRILQQDTGAMGRVHSGLGSSVPQRVLIAPLLLGEQIQGAVELAWLSNDTSDEVQQQTDDLLALFAMNIEIIWRNQRTSEALATLQASERKQAELLAFQQVLIDTIPYPVFYKGPDTRFLGFNQSYLTSFGACREALIGKRVLDLDYLPEVDRLAYQAEDESIIAGTGHIRREMLIPLADGKLHKTIYFVSGFRNADGSPGGLVGTFIDTGEQEESQPELEPLAEESHA
jgi:PAS domain S-box-containing protein